MVSFLGSQGRKPLTNGAAAGRSTGPEEAQVATMSKYSTYPSFSSAARITSGTDDDSWVRPGSGSGSGSPMSRK